MTRAVYSIPEGQGCEKVIRWRVPSKKWKRRKGGGRYLPGHYERVTCKQPATHIHDFTYYCKDHGPAKPGKYVMDPYYGTKDWRELRAAVIERDRGVCQYCGETAHQADHVVPRSKGGPDALHNLVAACHACNEAARSALFPSFAEKKSYILTRRKVTHPDVTRPEPIPDAETSFQSRQKPPSLFKQKMAERRASRV